MIDRPARPRSDTEAPCGCAGIFSAPVALESYAATFEAESALARFEAFASEFGPRFYGLPLNDTTVTLVRRSQRAPETRAAGETAVVPFRAGETLAWSLAD